MTYVGLGVKFSDLVLVISYSRVLVFSCSRGAELVLPEHIDLVLFCSRVHVSIYSIGIHNFEGK